MQFEDRSKKTKASEETLAVRHHREEYLCFGPLGKDSYLRYVPCAPNNPNYALGRIEKYFSNQADLGAYEAKDDLEQAQDDRLQMWQRYNDLKEYLAEHKELFACESVYEYLRNVSPLAKQQLVENPNLLGLHLKEITDFASRFFCNAAAESQFPDLLDDRQALLLAYVGAPLHDSLKYLGSFHAQVLPDHEVMVAELIRNNMTGLKVQLAGHTDILCQTDVDFLAAVVGDHENIRKEYGRSEWIDSDDVVERAKALFFIADVLTGVIVENPERLNEWSLDFTALDQRFVDLYFRHIDLEKGKIFRPAWGLQAVSDLSTSLNSLTLNHSCAISGHRPGLDVKDSLKEGALLAIERALEADDLRVRQYSKLQFSESQRKQIFESRRLLIAL